MTIWLNEGKDGLMKLSPQWDFLAAELVWNELRIVSKGNELYLIGELYHCDSLKKTGDFSKNNYKLDNPIICYMIIHKTEYEKRTQKDGEWKSVKTQPSLVEQYWVWFFEEYDQALQIDNNGAISVFMEMKNTEELTRIMTKTNLMGKPYAQGPWEQAINRYYHDLELIPVPEKITDEIIKKIVDVGTNGSGNGGKKNYSQSETERLKQRQDFALFIYKDLLNPNSDYTQVLTDMSKLLGTTLEVEQNKFIDRIFGVSR